MTTSSKPRSLTRMNDTTTEASETPEVVALPVEEVEEVEALDPGQLGLELPEDPTEARDLLLAEVAKSRDQASGLLDDLKRVAADFENYRKRAARESAEVLTRAAERVVRGLMPVLDSFDAALMSNSEPDVDDHFYRGVLNTRTQLLDALAQEGLEVIPTIGEPFDPEVHEPVGAPGGNGTLIVSQELRRGYTLNGKVLRAALVALENES